jgi:hypothetical protein
MRRLTFQNACGFAWNKAIYIQQKGNEMNTKRVVLIVVIAACVVAAIAVALKTRPAMENEPASTVSQQPGQPTDPLSEPLIAHMRDDEGIDIGPDASHALSISMDGPQVRIVVSDALIAKLGADLLPRLGMVEREATMSWTRYKRFLSDLHNVVVAAEGVEHHHHEGDSHEGHDEGATSPPLSSERP